ncbi:exodeoxyribonuclease V subunit alpha [Lautropia mirabilis]|uniref:exodeoxyribonuclease V subunit alpha n=1 Tax=Lautropia mirabilis TaxID=47671 RepID=UPI0028E82362|nr:exodeoxyribonuclease V subunit alpha [Lautropia mirabilis]
MTRGVMTRRGRKPVQDELTGDLFASLPETGGELEVVLPTDVAGMLALLARWHEDGWLRRIDLELAHFLAEGAEPSPALPPVLLAAALCSWQLGRGHVCLDLQAVLEQPMPALSIPVGPWLQTLTLADWQAACVACPSLVAQLSAVGATDEASTEGARTRPLVLVQHRLYLRRFWQYEQDVQQGIRQRLMLPGLSEEEEPRLQEALVVLFDGPGSAGAEPGRRADWQRIACALAARRRFGLITGGPGTGKTTTVIRLLALLQWLALAGQGQFLRIGLAAPTGKAAARLGSSISGAIDRLPLKDVSQGEAIRAAIPRSVSTLHRLLGSRPGTRHFRHDARNPLPLDVLVIDEASMIDLEMMAQVMHALPPRARLILLGDKDQLASVEAGAILGELCAHAREGRYWPETADWVARVAQEPIDRGLQADGAEDGTLLDQSVGMLRHSHRFGADSGIGRLAALVNDGEVARVQRLWDEVRAGSASGQVPDIARIEVDAERWDALRQLVVHGRLDGVPADQGPVGYAHYLRWMHRNRPADEAGQDSFDEWAAGVLQAHGRFQLLCALRQGGWGVERLNRQIALWLQSAGLLAASEGWYAGRPVIVTRNDYELGLMNGDVGIALAAQGGRLRVAFPAEGGSRGIRWVLPSRLQAAETVFAMTVHKAQGSEFDHAALAMPAELSPVLTRELVYTAITRARRFFTLVGPDELDRILGQAIRSRVLRASGLMAGVLQAKD